MRPERAHWLLVHLGMVPLLTAMALLYAAGWIMWRAHQVLPNATRGNCWSYTLSRWWPARDTTYVLMRDVREAKIWKGHGNALHAAHQDEDGTVTQTEPDVRYKGDDLRGQALYFAYHVRRADDKGQT